MTKGYSLDIIDKIDPIYHRYLAKKLIKTNREQDIIDNLEKFSNLDIDIAFKLFKFGEYRAKVKIIDNLNIFGQIDQQNDLLVRLIRVGEGWNIAQNFNKLEGLDFQDLVLELMMAKSEEGVENILYEICRSRNFTNLDHYDIVLKLIDGGRGRLVADSIDRFKGLNYQEIAQKLIDAGKVKDLVYNLEKFKDLNEAIAQKLIEGGQEVYLIERDMKSFNLDEGSEVFKILSIINKFNIKKTEGIFDRKRLEEEIKNSVIQRIRGYEIDGKYYREGYKELIEEAIKQGVDIEDNILSKLIEERITHIISADWDRENREVVVQEDIDFAKEKNLDIDLRNILQKRLEDYFNGLKYCFYESEAIFLISIATKNDIELDIKTPFVNMIMDGRFHLSTEPYGIINYFLEFAQKNSIDISSELNAVLQKEANDYILKGDLSNFNEKTVKLAHKYGLREPILNKELLEKYIMEADSDIEDLLNLARENNIELDLVIFLNQQLQVALQKNQISVMKKVISYSKEAEIKIDQELLKEVNDKFFFTDKFNLQNDEAETVFNQGLYEKHKDAKGKKELGAAQEEMTGVLKTEVWKNEAIILENFEKLERLFGLDITWQYLKQYNRHDALYFIPQLLEKIPVEEGGELTKDELERNRGAIRNLLLQTAADTSIGYEGLDSYQNLANAVKNFQPGWLAEFKEQNVFDNVKKFRKEVEKRRKLTPEVKELLGKLEQEKPEIHAYVSKLIEHPTVEMGAVIEFAEDPGRFFQRGDTHAISSLQEELAPHQLAEVGDGNYGVDLTLEEVRDALILGHLDQLCPFKPYTQEFSFLVKDKEAKRKDQELDKLSRNLDQDIKAFCQKEVGKGNGAFGEEFSRILELFRMIELVDSESLKKYTQENVDGILSGSKIPPARLEYLKERIREIKDVNDLKLVWKEILQFKGFKADFLVKRGKVALKKEKNVENLQVENFEASELEKLNAYFKEGIELLKKHYTGEELILRMEILAHQDPRFATIGDDTVCCMPFGSGKQNVYMFTPGCGAVTISFREAGQPPGEARIAVQSILTLNRRIGAEAHQKIIEKIKAGEQFSLTEILGQDFLQRFYDQDPTIVCDNVEGQKNYIKYLMANDNGVIGNLYQEFFDKWRKDHPEFLYSPVEVGKGYSDYLENLDEIDNESLPLAQVSYSDNAGEKSFSLIKGEKREVKKRRGVQSIGWQESLAVAYLEEKIYQRENPELIEGLTATQKILTASEIISKKEKIADLTVGHFDEGGVLDGYLLAYLAKEYSTGEKKIYFHDAAIDPEKQRSGIGMEMFRELLDRISNDEKLAKMPLTMRCREKTSYKIIKKYARQLGFEIVADEEFDVGGEAMHRVELRKVK